jgi:hypothetical protein
LRKQCNSPIEKAAGQTHDPGFAKTVALINWDLGKRLILRANGIYAKILLKFNFTCQDDIFMLQKYFYKF